MAELMIKCPKCFNPFSGPIKICVKGHSICERCLAASLGQCNMFVCPLCQSQILKGRNFQLEEVVENLKGATVTRKCVNFDIGCKHQIMNNDSEGHIKECSKRDFVCEGYTFCNWSCDWTGKSKDVFCHFEDYHEDQVMDGYKSEHEINLDLNSDNRLLYILDVSGDIFWFKCNIDVSAQKVYFYCQLIGSKEEANRFSYEFKISQGPNSCHTVVEYCQSDTTSDKEIWLSGKCPVFCFSTIKNFFVNNSTQLRFNFTIDG